MIFYIRYSGNRDHLIDPIIYMCEFGQFLEELSENAQAVQAYR